MTQNMMIIYGHPGGELDIDIQYVLLESKAFET